MTRAAANGLQTVNAKPLPWRTVWQLYVPLYSDNVAHWNCIQMLIVLVIINGRRSLTISRNLHVIFMFRFLSLALQCVDVTIRDIAGRSRLFTLVGHKLALREHLIDCSWVSKGSLAREQRVHSMAWAGSLPDSEHLSGGRAQVTSSADKQKPSLVNFQWAQVFFSCTSLRFGCAAVELTRSAIRSFSWPRS